MKKITDWWDRCLERHLCHSRSLILEAGLSTGTVSFPVRLLGSLLAQITLPDTAEELIYSRNFASSFWSHKVFIHTHGHMPEHSRRPRPTGLQQGTEVGTLPGLAQSSSCQEGLLQRPAITSRSSTELFSGALAWHAGLSLKGSSRTVSQQSLVGSRPSSTHSLYIWDWQWNSYNNWSVLWEGTRCEPVSSPIGASFTRDRGTVSHLLLWSAWTPLCPAPALCFSFEETQLYKIKLKHRFFLWILVL